MSKWNHSKTKTTFVDSPLLLNVGCWILGRTWLWSAFHALCFQLCPGRTCNQSGRDCCWSSTKLLLNTNWNLLPPYFSSVTFGMAVANNFANFQNLCTRTSTKENTHNQSHWSNLDLMQGEDSIWGTCYNEHRSVCWALWEERAASFWSKLNIGSEEQVAWETTPTGD